jgi:Ca-activated chloride channel family protein
MSKWITLSWLAITLSLAFALPSTSPARADGIIIPEPPICDPCPPPPCPGPFPCPTPSPLVQLAIRYHRVQVTIEDQVAITQVDQVFYNPNDWTVEGTYIFPLPLDAAVTGFTLWVDGEPVEGKILDAAEARRTYEEIVSSLRDPALLEYAGQGAVQASIFPIPPLGERRIQLEYTQALSAENGLVRYTYPLNTEKFSLWPLENVSVSVDIRSTESIRAVYSSSHPVDLQRENSNTVKASYEASNITPNTDFTLFYSLGETEAFHLLSFRDPSDPDDPDGFFLLLLAPRPDVTTENLPKDVLLVLDRSGSMEGEKFLQAQDALRYILEHINPEDRFNIISFSTGLETYASGLRPAEEAAEALPWVDRLSAQGATDINRALLEAASMVDRERPTYLIFLTDGLPTEGVTDSPMILANLAETAPRNLRLFAFGVGYDVDTFLLDSLAQAHHGTSSYVLPGERLDESLSTFYAKISTPVLTNLELDFGDLRVYDMYPSPLPDLFSGSQIISVGRYREGGTTEVTLTGEVNGEQQTFRFVEQNFARRSLNDSATLAALPRLWATRKIGHLLNQVRLQGANQELIDQIVRLSIRYGIVTPYTSYLVTEPLPLGAAAQEDIANQAFEALQAMPTAASSGQAAVEKAADQGAMAQAEVAAAPSGDAAQQVRILGAKTFVFSGDRWVDTAYDPDRDNTTPVAFLSDDYFRLAEAQPDLAAAFALGPAVTVLADGVAYEIVAEGVAVEPIEIADTPTPVVQTEPNTLRTSETGDVSNNAETPNSPDEPNDQPANPLCGSALLVLVALGGLPLGLVSLRKGYLR